MRWFVMTLLLLPQVSFAEARWLHFRIKDQAVFNQVTAELDSLLGRQRAYVYGGIYEVDGDYVFDEARTDDVTAIIRHHQIDFEIRRPASELRDWFPNSALAQSDVLPADDQAVLRDAQTSLAAMSRLINTVAINAERSFGLVIPDGKRFVASATAIGQRLIHRLGEARRPGLDDFLLTFGQFFNWAALPFVESSDHLFTHYLRRVTNQILDNRQTMREYHYRSEGYVKRSSQNGGGDFDRLGLSAGDRASDLPRDHGVRNLMAKGDGIAFLRLARPDSTGDLLHLAENIRNWYGPIESHVAARNEAARFDRFSVGMTPALAERVWDFVKADLPVPDHLILDHARDKNRNMTEKEAAADLENRFDQAQYIFRVDGDLTFHNFMLRLAHGGTMVHEAYSGDQVKLVNYHMAMTHLLFRLITVNPPKLPSTYLELLEAAAITRNQVRRLIDFELPEAGALLDLTRALRLKVLADVNAFNVEGCEMNLNTTGILPALRRTRPRRQTSTKFEYDPFVG